VILEALEALGIRAEFSGRNDLLAQGRKFSGNAYYKNGTAAYHHGTLLVNADMEKLGRYLSPDRKKLQSKGVDSVPSRVCNLSELDPAVTVDALRVTLKEAFGSVYGEWESLTLTDDDRQKIHALTYRNRDWAWNYGQKLPFTLSWEERFPWGGVEIHLQIEQGRVARSKVYTDAMDATLADRIEDALRGCVFSTAELTAAVEGLPCGADLGRLIMRQEL
jgi:lipoate-protein ligase A